MDTGTLTIQERRRRQGKRDREEQAALVLEQIRRRDLTARELVERTGLSLFLVRRALKRLRKDRLIGWVAQWKSRQAYTRLYIAKRERAPRARQRA